MNGTHVVILCALALLGNPSDSKSARGALAQYNLTPSALLGDPTDRHLIVRDASDDVLVKLANVDAPADELIPLTVEGGAIREAVVVVRAALDEGRDRDLAGVGERL